MSAGAADCGLSPVPPPDPTTVPAPHPPLPEAGAALLLLAESVAHRAELVAIELAEAREHAVRCLLLTGAAGALALFAGFALTLLVASQVWDDPHRAWWLGGLTVAYLAAAFAAGRVLSRRLQDWRPLNETQRQLQQDYQCLSNQLKSAVR